MGQFPYTPVACSCERCRAMCANSTCLPTPFEARELIRAGYGPRMAHYTFPVEVGPNGPVHADFIAPAPAGQEGARNIRATALGRPCTFFTEDGKCELHDTGLKPWEGRYAHHDRPWQTIRIHAINPWRKGKIGQSIVNAFNRVCPPADE